MAKSFFDAMPRRIGKMLLVPSVWGWLLRGGGHAYCMA